MQGGKEASRTEEGADLTSPEEEEVAVEEAAAGVEKEELLIGTKMMMMTSVSILDHLLPTGTEYFDAVWLWLECHYTVVRGFNNVELHCFFFNSCHAVEVFILLFFSFFLSIFVKPCLLFQKWQRTRQRSRGRKRLRPRTGRWERSRQGRQGQRKEQQQASSKVSGQNENSPKSW